MTPSQRLKQAIKNSKIGYIELGKRTGIAKSSIQRYASGVTKKIPIDAIEKLAPILGVSPAYIMGWTDINGNMHPAKLSNEPVIHPILTKIGVQDIEEMIKELIECLDRDSYTSKDAYEALKASLESALLTSQIVRKYAISKK